MLKNLILAAVVVTPTASGLLELLAVSPSGEDEIRGDPVAGSLVQTSENNAHVEGGGDQDKKTMLKASTNLFGRLRQSDGSYEELDATSLIPINIHEPTTPAAFVQVSRPGSIGADEEFGSQPVREQKFGGRAASIFDWDPPVWVRHACFGALGALGVAVLLYVLLKVCKEMIRYGSSACCGWLRKTFGINTIKKFPLQIIIHRLRDTRHPNESRQYQIRVSHAGELHYKTQVAAKSSWDEPCHLLVRQSYSPITFDLYVRKSIGSRLKKCAHGNIEIQKDILDQKFPGHLCVPMFGTDKGETFAQLLVSFSQPTPKPGAKKGTPNLQALLQSGRHSVSKTPIRGNQNHTPTPAIISGLNRTSTFIGGIGGSNDVTPTRSAVTNAPPRRTDAHRSRKTSTTEFIDLQNLAMSGGPSQDKLRIVANMCNGPLLKTSWLKKKMINHKEKFQVFSEMRAKNLYCNPKKNTFLLKILSKS